MSETPTITEEVEAVRATIVEIEARAQRLSATERVILAARAVIQQTSVGCDAAHRKLWERLDELDQELAGPIEADEGTP